MGKQKQKQYTNAFKAEAVKLVLKDDQTPAEIEKDLVIATSTLNRWVREAKVADPDQHRHEDVYKELAAVKKENRILRKERDILKKATALFARTSQ